MIEQAISRGCARGRRAPSKVIRRYLYRLNYSAHDIRFEKIPGSSGCGEQWVRERYAPAVCAYRARAARATTALVVIIDADTEEVAWRSAQLRDALGDAQIKARSDDEKIVHLIPKRHIETWILCLNGTEVNEEHNYKGRIGTSEELTKSAAVALFELSRSDARLPNTCVPSIRLALPELKRLE